MSVCHLLLRRGENTAERGNVLMVPSVAIGDAGALGDARDLVAVVPPRHHARVRGRVVPHPMVGLAVVIQDDLLPRLQPGLEHDLRLRRALGELRPAGRTVGRSVSTAMSYG